MNKQTHTGDVELISKSAYIATTVITIKATTVLRLNIVYPQALFTSVRGYNRNASLSTIVTLNASIDVHVAVVFTSRSICPFHLTGLRYVAAQY